MLRRNQFHQPIRFFLILSAALLVRSVDIISRKSQRHPVLPRNNCKIPHSNDHYYLKSSCAEKSQCRLRVNDSVEGNGTIVIIKCEYGYSFVVQDIAVCFDGKWYPTRHSCIKLSSTCGLASPMYAKDKLKEKSDIITAPWHAEVLELNEIDNFSYKTLCGGTLITPKIVLTAFSCVTEGKRKLKKDPEKLLVGLGRTSSSNNHFNQLIKVQQVSEGPRGFGVLMAVGFRQLEEIVILKLDPPAAISYDVMPSCFDSSILNPQTGYSFLSGVVVGLTKKMTEESPRAADITDVNFWRRNKRMKMRTSGATITPLQPLQKVEAFQVSITDQSSMQEDESFIFTTNLLNIEHLGSGFIVEVSGRYYILGVHIRNHNNNNGSTASRNGESLKGSFSWNNYKEQGSVFNKVYFGSIGRNIEQFIKENQ